jgi:hypothetical protein
MAEPITNGSLSMQLISDAQASILDFVLFPGFTRISAAFQEHLGVDLTFYVPLLCILGLLMFIGRRIYEFLSGLLETCFS